jgi:hypothetical protein
VTSAASTQPVGRGQRWLALALVAAAVVPYLSGVTSRLTMYDDPLYIVNKVQNREPGWAGFAAVWNADYVWRGEYVEFFPLRDSVYWLLYQRWETWSVPYHVTSILFHVASCLLLLALVRRLGASSWVAWATAFIFATHPIHIESVVWAAGLKDPMYTSFMLASLVFYCDYRQRAGAWRYALSLGFLIASLMVKSMAISTPALMLFIELWVGERARWRLVAARLAGPFVITGIYLAQFIAIGRANQAVVGPHGGTWVNHTVVSMWAQVKYLKQVFVPSSFRLIYCFEPTTSWADWRLWVAVGLLAVVGALVWSWRRQPLRVLCVGWYFACLFPVSNLVPFPAIMADRYLYAASAGGCLLVALLLEWMKPALRTFSVAAIAVALGLTTAARAGLWHDEENLWREPDEDPECVADPEYPATDSHLLRYWSAKDRRTGLLALERAMVTKGLTSLSYEHFCHVLTAGAAEAAALGDLNRGIPWARRAMRMCPTRPETWNVVMLLNIHDRPQLAADAAQKALRVLKVPRMYLMRALTQVEVGNDGYLNEALEAVQLDPARCCPMLQQWSEEVSPALQVKVAQHLEVCATAKPSTFEEFPQGGPR